MDIMNVLKKSWDNVMHYRSLWIFGVIFALTTFSFPYIMLLGSYSDDKAGENSRNQSFVIVTPSSQHIRMGGNLDFGKVVIDRVVILYHGQVPDFTPRDGDLLLHWNSNNSLAYTVVTSQPDGLLDYDRRTVNPDVIRTITGMLIMIGIVGFVTYVLAKIARYVSSTALISMVAMESESGDKLSMLEGLRKGWSRAAWRTFLIDVCVYSSFVLGFLVLFCVAVLPVVFTMHDNGVANLAGIFITSGLFMMAIVAAIFGRTLLNVIRVFVHRACVLEDLGVFSAIRSGLTMLRSDLMSAVITWVLWFSIHVIWPILLLPVVFLLLSLALIVGSVTGYLASGFSSMLISGEALPVITGIVAGSIMFVLSLTVPISLLDGLLEVFTSSMWTLTYRAIRKDSERQAMKVTEMPTLSVAQA